MAPKSNAGSIGVKDVARQAGVSLGTVSNVLNRPEMVNPATRSKVLAAIEELGFVRNEAARQLRAGRSRVIGVIVLDVANPFFTDLAAGVEEAAADVGLQVVLCNSAADAEREARYLSMLEEQRAFGILITPVDNQSAQVDSIRKRGTSVVLADRAAKRALCSVSVDDEAGGEMAAAHLLDRGHRRLAFVGGPLSTPQVADRLTGARRAVSAVKGGGKAATVTVLETSGLTIGAGRQAGARLADLPLGKRPTAVFCANDLLALGFLQELTRRDLRVPEDIALVGYDDIDFAAASTVPLTSVRQPRAELGRAAAELLIDEVHQRDQHRHRQVVFSPELVIRESTGVAVPS